MAEFKGTKEKWHSVEFAGIILIQDEEYYEGNNIFDYEAVGEEVAKANAQLAICAQEMLQELQLIFEKYDKGTDTYIRLEKLINKATA